MVGEIEVGWRSRKKLVGKAGIKIGWRCWKKLVGVIGKSWLEKLG